MTGHQSPMSSRTRTPEETYGPALVKARRDFRTLDPARTMVRAAVDYEELAGQTGHFLVPFFQTTYAVTWPAGEVCRDPRKPEADISTRLILLHYLLAADGTPMASTWIAFRNLPGGLGYNAAFLGRASHRLARAFGSDVAGFRTAARALGGESLSFGDASFLFRLLPRVWLAAVLHLADDEFPAAVNVLFDGAAGHYLPTEDLAVLAGMLASRLIKAGRPG